MQIFLKEILLSKVFYINQSMSQEMGSKNEIALDAEARCFCLIIILKIS